MNTIKYILLMVLLPVAGLAQSPPAIGNFEKIVVSPHINLVLIKGDDPGVRIESANIDTRKINVETDNNVLSIYLEGARFHNKYEKYERYDNNYRGKWREDVYRGAEVTAYVTYEYLESIQIRGEQIVRAEDTIDQHTFKVVLYGEVDVRLKKVIVKELRLSTFGENEILIESGLASEQVLRCYGENELDLSGIESVDIRSSLYGENRLNLRADGEIKVTAFGESDIRFSGDAFINRGLIIGETYIRRLSQ
ncbi:MAG: DUF2807 domain-containing protein [Cyclobacteriaceae bacterium]